jgi:hypothetical protein
LSYDVGWNAGAFEGPVTFNYSGYFDGGGDSEAYVGFQRDLWSPGTVRFSYSVAANEVLATLETDANPFVDTLIDPYVVLTTNETYPYSTK